MQTVNSVRVILSNEKGEILLLKRANSAHENGKWAIPGGKVEEKDTEEEACKREVKEETNLDIIKLNYLFSLNSPPIDDQECNYVARYFVASFKGTVKIDSESSEYKWVSPKKIDSLKIAFNQKEGIRKYLATLS